MTTNSPARGALPFVEWLLTEEKEAALDNCWCRPGSFCANACRELGRLARTSKEDAEPAEDAVDDIAGGGTIGLCGVARNAKPARSGVEGGPETAARGTMPTN